MRVASSLAERLRFALLVVQGWRFRAACRGLLAEYLESQEDEQLQRWCRSLGRFALNKDELAEIDKSTDKESKNQALIKKVQPPIQPLWSLFVTLCHALQEDENQLTAKDAYWLG